MNMRQIYNAQELVGLHLADAIRIENTGKSLESDTLRFWELANWISRKTFTYIAKLRNGDTKTKLEAQAHAKYVLMRLRKSDLINEFDCPNPESGREIYMLIGDFKKFLEVIIKLKI